MADRPKGKEEERGKIPYFKTIPLSDLVKEMGRCKDAEKYVYIADMSGKAVTFFTYQHQWELCEWHG